MKTKKTRPHILGIDRWSKYVGLAYMDAELQIPLPIGYIQNDGSVFFVIGDYLMRYNIQTIVVWYPKKSTVDNKNTFLDTIQSHIDKFIENLKLLITPDISICTVSENYTTIQAGDIVSNFRKNAAEDTVSAMLILERRKNQKETD